MLRDGETFELESHGQRWSTAWHAGVVPPDGQPHGAAGICATETGDLVLISADGTRWDFPAGRPEGTESFEQTLRREVMEEACATVIDARLLGFSRGECIRGSELGLVLVRSIWFARVQLHEWKPQFEIGHRAIVSAETALLKASPAFRPLWECAFARAGL